jgi:hypothetical protein
MNEQSITYNGRRWSSPNELVYKMYDFIGKELRQKVLKYGDRFYYPELASDLHNNHYFLKENNIVPEFFLVQKDLQSDMGFSILLFSSKFPSQYQYRKIEVQPANNYLYKKDLLRARLDDELKRRQDELFKKNPACSRCAIQLNKKNFQAIYEHFEIEKMIDQVLLDFSKNMFYSAVQYNYAKTDRSRLNLTNPLVKALLKRIDQVNILLFCPKCVDLWAKDHLMEELANPATSDIRIRHIIRQMTRKNLVADLKDICEKVSQELAEIAKSSASEVCSQKFQVLWQEMHFIARDLYEFKEIRPFLKIWSQYLQIPKLLNCWVGEGFLAMLYRLDQPEWNTYLIDCILKSELNLFRFFRTMGQYTINTNIICLLFAYIQKNPPSEQKVLDCLEGYLYTRQVEAIQSILQHIGELNQNSQRIIIRDYFDINLDNGVELIQNMLFSSPSDENQQKIQLSPEIIDYYHQTEKEFMKRYEEDKLYEINNESKIKEEDLIVAKENSAWKKKKGHLLIK